MGGGGGEPVEEVGEVARFFFEARREDSRAAISRRRFVLEGRVAEG